MHRNPVIRLVASPARLLRSLATGQHRTKTLLRSVSTMAAADASSGIASRFAEAGVVIADGGCDCALWKGASDERRYRALTFKSGVRAILISDPAAEKSAAALSVAVGHLADPPHISGLAHAVEHMLFLGTGKYEDEAGYKTFLKSHGGGSNASTGPEATTYHFFVHPDHLPEALDRFSRFFIDPLFAPSATGRELNAINSENDKNVQDDGRRALQVRKHLAAPGHVYTKFGTGNLLTLRDRPAAQGLDIRDELIRHYKAHYSGGLMSLAVLGRQSLEELTALVTGAGAFNTSFDGVPDTGAAMPLDKSRGHPYPSSRTGKIVYLTPVRDLRTLTLIWPAPDAPQPDYAHSTRLVGHLLGHEGRGSVLALLKERGWATSLSAGGSAYRHFSTFEVSVSLTSEGLTHADDVIATVYRYVALLRSAPESVLRQHWEEVAQVAANSLRFRAQQSPVSAVTALATGLANYPACDVLVAPHLLQSFDYAATASVMALLTPQNMIVLRSAKEDAGWLAQSSRSADSNSGSSNDSSASSPATAADVTAHTEPYYGLTYYFSPFSTQQLAAWGGADTTSSGSRGVQLPSSLTSQAELNGWTLASVVPAPSAEDAAAGVVTDLHLPLPNDFIPSDFSLRPIEGVGLVLEEEAAAAAASAAGPSDHGTAASVAAASDATSETAASATVEAASPTASSLPPPDPASSALPAPSPSLMVEGVAALRGAEEGNVGREADVDVVVKPVNGASIADDSALAAAAHAPPTFVLKPHPLDGHLDGSLRPSASAASAFDDNTVQSLSVTVKYPEPLPLSNSVGKGSSSSPLQQGLTTQLLWHRQDVTFRLPKSFFFAQLALPSHAAQATSPRNKVLASLFTACVNDQLGTLTYDAEVAGLHYDLSSASDVNALTFCVSGFSHKLSVLLRRLCSAVADFDGTMGITISSSSVESDAAYRTVFARRYDALRRSLLNNSKAQPYVRARQLTSEWTHLPYVTAEDSLAVLAEITPDELRRWAKSAVAASPSSASCGSESSSDHTAPLLAFSYGNVTRADSARLAQDAASALQLQLQQRQKGDVTASAIAAAESDSACSANAVVPDARYVLLPPSTCHVISRPHPNPEERNCAVHVTWQLGATTPRSLAAASLFGMLTSQPVFDTLRTKEQLGYMVFSGVETPQSSGLTWTVTVQSSNSSVGHLQARIDACVAGLRDVIAALSDDDVRAKASILAHRMTEADKTQGAEAGRLWAPLAQGTLDFHFSEACAAAAISSITRQSLLDLFDRCIASDGPLLRKLVTRVYAQLLPATCDSSSGGIAAAPSATAGPDSSLPAAPAAATSSNSNSASPATTVLHGGGPVVLEPHPQEMAPEVTAAAFKARAADVDWATWKSDSRTPAVPSSCSGVWLPTAPQLARMGRK